jgi:hypothetical protein
VGDVTCIEIGHAPTNTPPSALATSAAFGATLTSERLSAPFTAETSPAEVNTTSSATIATLPIGNSASATTVAAPPARGIDRSCAFVVGVSPQVPTYTVVSFVARLTGSLRSFARTVGVPPATGTDITTPAPRSTQNKDVPARARPATSFWPEASVTGPAGADAALAVVVAAVVAVGAELTAAVAALTLEPVALAAALDEPDAPAPCGPQPQREEGHGRDRTEPAIESVHRPPGSSPRVASSTA